MPTIFCFDVAGSQRRQPAGHVSPAQGLGHIEPVFLGPAHQRMEGALADDRHLQAKLGMAVATGHDVRQLETRSDQGRQLATKLAGAGWVSPRIRRKAGGVHERPDDACLRGNVQLLPQPRAFPRVERHHDVRRRLRAGMECSLRHCTHGQGRAVTVALQVDEAPRGFDGDLGGWRIRQRASEAKRRHAGMDQARKALVQRPAEARLDEYICVREIRLRVVRNHTVLACAHRRPVQRLALVEWPHVAGITPGGRLDLDDLGAELSEDASRHFAPARGGVDDANAGERRRRHGSRGFVPMTPFSANAAISSVARPSTSDRTSELCWPRVGAGRSMSKGASPTR